MSEYIPPDPAEAEQIYRAERESGEQYRRLEHAPAGQLIGLVRDPAGLAAARGNALLILLKRKDPMIPELLPELFEDPALGHLAIRYCPVSDPRVSLRLRGLLDHCRDRVWSQAALALARAKDETLRPRLLEWFHQGDLGHRNVAIEGLIHLDAGQATEIFRHRWGSGGLGEEDRLVLAAALLRLGDTRGLGLLEASAGRAEGAWSVFAAASVAGHDGVRGLRLMLWILDHGNLEAKRSVVSHGWNMARLPHAFTADGVEETRLWLEQQLQRQLAGAGTSLPG
ncbi:MAG TPA: hypothetical protein VG013_07650 [Gemmataceae bacterium]|nr:hypothetical protein [Gemmataceae bacterium]